MSGATDQVSAHKSLASPRQKVKGKEMIMTMSMIVGEITEIVIIVIGNQNKQVIQEENHLMKTIGVEINRRRIGLVES